MTKIVIIGSGFGGLTAVKTLRRQGHQGTITLISPRPILFYYPSLIWIPAGLRTEADLTIPLNGFFKDHSVQHHQANVTGLDPVKKQVETDNGIVEFDGLIIASGSRFIRRLPGINDICIPCEGYDAVKKYTDDLAKLDSGTLAFGFASNPKEPIAMRGGPIFEFMFGMDTLLRKQKRRDKFKLVFFSPSPEPGKRLGEKAVKALLGEMKKHQIETYLGHKMKGFSNGMVHTETDDIASDLTMFMPGLTGPTWLVNSGLSLSDGGFIKADAHCQVVGFKDIYAVGDCGNHPGPQWLPKQAHMADLQAETASKNLLTTQKGLKPNSKFNSELICIVDTLEKGMLIYRSPKHTIMLPKMKMFNWAKRFFEWYYLRSYR